MRKLLLLLALLPTIAFGQGTVIQQNPVAPSGGNFNKQVFQWSNGSFINNLSAPIGTNATLNNATPREGLFFFATQDTTIQVFHNGHFIPFGGGGSSSSIYFDRRVTGGLGTFASPITWPATFQMFQNEYWQNNGNIAKYDSLQVLNVTANGNSAINLNYFNAHTGIPAGSNTQIQYNNSGAFGASANFIWDNTHGRLNIGQPDAAVPSSMSTIANVGELDLISDTGAAANNFHLLPQNNGASHQGLRFASNTTEIMTLGAHGGARIGDSGLDPTSKLDVNSDDSLSTSPVLTITSHHNTTVYDPTFRVYADGSAYLYHIVNGTAGTDSVMVHGSDGHIKAIPANYYATSAVGGYVPTSRQVIAGTDLSGGGALSADVTINADTTKLQTVANFFPKGDTRYAKISSLPAGANPTATAGASPVNGSAATFMRSDAAPKVDSTVFATKNLLSTYLPKASIVSTYQTLANLQTTLDSSATHYPSTGAVTSTIGKTQVADYVITAVGTAITATPRAGSGYTAYTGTVLSTVLTSVMGNLTSGGLIHIGRGTFTGNSLMTVPYSGIVIEGEGMYNTIIQLKASADVGVSVSTGLFGLTTQNNVTFRNLQLDGNGANQTKIDNNASTTAVLEGIYSGGNYTRVQNCYIHDFTQYGYCAAGAATNAYITNSKLFNNYWNQVTFINGTSNCSIINSEISGGGDAGISAYSSGHIISGNTITAVSGSHGSTGAAWGIGLETTGGVFSTNIQVLNNTITGASMIQGIYVTTGATGCTLQGNYIYNINGTGGCGITLNGASNCSIIDNTIFSILTEGIYFNTGSNNIVSGNYIYSCSDQGMKIEAFGSGAVNNNNITNNYAAGTNRGLLINATGSGTDAGNIVSDNTFSGATDFTDNGSSIKNNNYGVTAAAWLPNTQSSINGISVPASAGSTINLAAGSTMQITGAFTLNNTLTASSTPTYPTGSGTLAYLGGTNNWSGLQEFTGGFQSNTSAGTSNLFVNGAGAAAGASGTAGLQFGGSSTISARAYMSGTTSTSIGSTGYAAFIVGSQPVTVLTSSTAPFIAQAVINPFGTITKNGSASVTNTAVLYVGAAAAAGTNNYTAYFNTGNVQIANGNLTLGTAGNELKITEGSGGFAGQTTLSSGTKAITISGVTTSSRAFVQLVSPSGGSLTIQYQAVCTSNTLTIQANIAAGTINTADGSSLNYFIIN